MPLNEADTCRVYVTPKIKEAGWEDQPHSITEQKTFTDGRVHVRAGTSRRGDEKRADYVLRYTRDYPIAVVQNGTDKLTAAERQWRNEYTQ